MRHDVMLLESSIMASRDMKARGIGHNEGSIPAHMVKIELDIDVQILRIQSCGLIPSPTPLEPSDIKRVLP